MDYKVLFSKKHMVGFYCPIDLWNEVGKRASESGASKTRYVIDALMDKIYQEDNPKKHG
jgi:hypothetical protein